VFVKFTTKQWEKIVATGNRLIRRRPLQFSALVQQRKVFDVKTGPPIPTKDASTINNLK
jgi:hypothetical protein